MARKNHSHIEKSIASLVEVTDQLLRGEFTSELPDIDAEGVVSVLAQKINAMLVNMKTVEVPLASAGERTPCLVSHVQDVVQLMEQTTGAVLDNSDKILMDAEALEAMVRQGGTDQTAMLTAVMAMKTAMYDIIASQSYQDVARQRMEKIIADLNQIRDWLLEVLVILNIKKDSSAENVEKKKALLREVQAASTPPMKQDLVDDLLAEFGF